jgi:hypothetical protein
MMAAAAPTPVAEPVTMATLRSLSAIISSSLQILNGGSSDHYSVHKAIAVRGCQH